MELLLNKVCGQPAALPVAVRRCGPADAAARAGGVSVCWKSSLSLPSLFSEFGGHTGNVDAQNGAGFHRHYRREDPQTVHPTSPCAGVNRRLAMSSRVSRLAPVSALRLYTSPGAASNQVIFPAPLSS